MGEVYRARDTRLNREVAIKVLPDAVRADPDRLARFERKRRRSPSLNHPNIAQIYGLEEAVARSAGHGAGRRDDARRSHRARGDPIDEALPIARQIADALERRTSEASCIAISSPPTSRSAGRHSEGARLRSGEGAGSAEAAPEPRHSPTITVAMTQMGVLLGTAAYMAPNRRGKSGGRARRHLGIRMRAVRDARRTPAVSRRGDHRCAGESHRAGTGLAGAAGHHAARRAPAAPPMPGEEPEAPTGGDRRCPPRSG